MMSPDERAKYVRVAILRVLDQCGSYLLGEQTLFLQLNMEVAPAASTAEFKSALDSLTALQAVTSVRGDLGGDLRYKITAQGRAVLAENM